MRVTSTEVSDGRGSTLDGLIDFAAHVLIVALRRRSNPAGELLTKFSASSVLPLPLYLATCGYGNNGRVRVTLPLRSRCSAMSLSGGVPSSTQRRIASIRPTGVAPGPRNP